MIHIYIVGIQEVLSYTKNVRVRIRNHIFFLFNNTFCVWVYESMSGRVRTGKRILLPRQGQIHGNFDQYHGTRDTRHPYRIRI